MLIDDLLHQGQPESDPMASSGVEDVEETLAMVRFNARSLVRYF